MAESPHKDTPDIAIRNRRTNGGGASAGVTELEGVILGIVWSRQPCSPYVVLSRFQRSPTWGWSSSTGAIYPAIRRLKARGLLDYRSDLTGRRRSEVLSLSEQGAGALHEWISTLTDEMGSAGIDPIRARVNYLPALEPKERIAFLDRAEEITRSRLELARASKGDPEAKQNWTLLATASAVVHQLEARLRWIRELRELVERQNAGGSSPA